MSLLICYLAGSTVANDKKLCAEQHLKRKGFASGCPVEILRLQASAKRHWQHLECSKQRTSRSQAPERAATARVVGTALHGSLWSGANFVREFGSVEREETDGGCSHPSKCERTRARFRPRALRGWSATSAMSPQSFASRPRKPPQKAPGCQPCWCPISR